MCSCRHDHLGDLTRLLTEIFCSKMDSRSFDRRVSSQQISTTRQSLLMRGRLNYLHSYPFGYPEANIIFYYMANKWASNTSLTLYYLWACMGAIIVLTQNKVDMLSGMLSDMLYRRYVIMYTYDSRSTNPGIGLHVSCLIDFSQQIFLCWRLPIFFRKLFYKLFDCFWHGRYKKQVRKCNWF